MAMTSSNPQTYLSQWLEVATKGNVKAEFALIADRMRLHCYKCGAKKTFTSPEGTTVDWLVQEWVKEHAHKAGGWN